MQPLRLRRATEADTERVRALTRTAYAKWVSLIGREPLPMTADYGQAIARHVIDVVEEGDELLALIETIPRPTHLLIENLAVRPDLQGKGYGEALLGHAETFARSLGLDELRLYTNAAFASNIAFYCKRGFEEFARETLGPGKQVVHMSKRLSRVP